MFSCLWVILTSSQVRSHMCSSRPHTPAEIRYQTRALPLLALALGSAPPPLTRSLPTQEPGPCLSLSFCWGRKVRVTHLWTRLPRFPVAPGSCSGGAPQPPRLCVTWASPPFQPPVPLFPQPQCPPRGPSTLLFCPLHRTRSSLPSHSRLGSLLPGSTPGCPKAASTALVCAPPGMSLPR